MQKNQLMRRNFANGKDWNNNLSILKLEKIIAIFYYGKLSYEYIIKKIWLFIIYTMSETELFQILVRSNYQRISNLRILTLTAVMTYTQKWTISRIPHLLSVVRIFIFNCLYLSVFVVLTHFKCWWPLQWYHNKKQQQKQQIWKKYSPVVFFLFYIISFFLKPINIDNWGIACCLPVRY